MAAACATGSAVASALTAMAGRVGAGGRGRKRGTSRRTPSKVVAGGARGPFGSTAPVGTEAKAGARTGTPRIAEGGATSALAGVAGASVNSPGAPISFATAAVSALSVQEPSAAAEAVGPKGGGRHVARSYAASKVTRT